MIGTLKKYIAFTAFVLRYGHLEQTGTDFNQTRKESLQDLQDFIPPGYSSIKKNHQTQNILAQFAFIKNSIKTTGGHLTTKSISYIR